SLVGANGDFLKALYRDGIGGYYDGLSVDYYNLTLAALRSIRAVQLRYGDSKPLWLMEVGWPTCFDQSEAPQNFKCVSEGQQAVNLADILRGLTGRSYVR